LSAEDGHRTLETIAWPGSYGDEAKPRMGFFTDTSICIGCKACEVACKEWNQIPMSMQGFTGKSYDNTIDLGANTWRHVAFVEQRLPATVDDGASLVEAAARGQAMESGVQTYQEGEGLRWLMASDVCKHGTHAARLAVRPTGALSRTEYGTVVGQDAHCNVCSAGESPSVLVPSQLPHPRRRTQARQPLSCLHIANENWINTLSGVD